MCLVGIALAASARFPLVIAANRDEFFARPTAALDWWTPEGRDEPILAGRDLRGGGTWLGIGTTGRIALVTNVREPEPANPGAPSRGKIVETWLRGDASFDALEQHVLTSGFAGVNVLAFDVVSGEQVHISNRGRARTALDAGIHGLSNATIDTPWPKVTALEARIAAALEATTRDEVTTALFAALADGQVADDRALPSTGVPPDVERRLSPAFIRMPEAGYGTRSSSVLIRESDTLHLVERSFGADGAPLGDRRGSVDLRAAPFHATKIRGSVAGW